MSVSMINKNQTRGSKWLDIFLWVLIISMAVSGSYLLYYFREQISIFRLLFTFSGLAVLIGIASQTSQGVQTILYARTAWVEMTKVVWPKPSEAKHISIVVVCAIAFITTVLWIVDTILTVLVRSLLG